MINTIIIMAGIIICVYIVAHADIKIAVNHTTKDLTEHKKEVMPELTLEQYQKMVKEQEAIPTFDNAVKAIQEAIGGYDDAI